ncbi:MAG: 2-amino-3,7-dideoxy-D-threo-hept-6-ulosonate synthase [Thermoplasmata archaeon]|jgi:fructose-bisphosphate aldolase/2-amino-3,7-dideoxy-D-threo-hept-6-ulosonate synthase|nr:2-amino-3,7-dideoxy-D-threo-hept-6-ulosonate synthase [Thermoplasmata archaeon]
MYGKSIRMRRLFPNPARRLFSVPLDHAVSMGPIDGLEELAPLARELEDGGVDLLIVTKGAVRELAPVLDPEVRLGIHVSASTSLGPSANRKVLVASASEAVSLGADLLSVQVNFGIPEEPDMLTDLGVAADQCRQLGLPLLCMAYVKKEGGGSPDELRHAARAAADLGADIVKTSYPGSLDEFRRLCRTTPVPLLIGGGVRVEPEASFLRLVEESVQAGGAGICIGRNLFQRRPVAPLARRIAAILHGAS